MSRLRRKFVGNRLSGLSGMGCALSRKYNVSPPTHLGRSKKRVAKQPTALEFKSKREVNNSTTNSIHVCLVSASHDCFHGPIRRRRTRISLLNTSMFPVLLHACSLAYPLIRKLIVPTADLGRSDD